MTAEPRDDFPHEIEEIENVFIELSDGCRLAARIWMPVSAESDPVPAILEYLPYRKRDFMRARDEPMHRYYAGHGYAAVRVDLRGSGDSDGILEDEYLEREQLDAVEVIDWLSRQSWCDGAVGMTGISWGGFNALQVASHAPAALRAVITLCAADDRYADDAHYMGGCLLAENQIWGTVLFSLGALPPDPEIVGERWRSMWMQRLAADRPYPAVWLEHQRRDELWQQGSICENFSRIRCPVYAIGGWADGYSNAVERLLEGLEVPRKGLIGPWAHCFPHEGVPGPSIGYLQEALRWWDKWLKGIETGVMDEPQLRVWMQDGVDPAPHHELRPGRWVAEDAWPSHRIERRRFVASATNTLVAESARQTQQSSALVGVPGKASALPPDALFMDISSPPTTGLAGGDWCGFGAEGEAPLDQRPDDGGSLCFDSAAFESDLEILGAPSLELELRSDQPVALLAVRLCELRSDGSSSLVTYGVLNLTHRDSHADPRALVPGETTRVRVPLNSIAHRFAKGRSMRLAIATNYWPLVWPSPQPTTVGVRVASLGLELPVRPVAASDAILRAFEVPEAARAVSVQRPLRPSSFVRAVERDLTTNDVVYKLVSEGGDLGAAAVAHIDAIDLELTHTVERRFTINESDSAGANSQISEHVAMRRQNWKIGVHALTRLSSTTENFRLQAELRATENEEVVFERVWDETIKRDLV